MRTLKEQVEKAAEAFRDDPLYVIPLEGRARAVAKLAYIEGATDPDSPLLRKAIAELAAIGNYLASCGYDVPVEPGYKGPEHEMYMGIVNLLKEIRACQESFK